MEIEIKNYNLTEGQINSFREIIIDFFGTDFQVELEYDTVRFKDN